jgi:hypothetical protein
MVEMISRERQLLSAFAQASGQKQCALGLDFEDYNRGDHSVPVYLLGAHEVGMLATVEGKKLIKAYRRSQVGKNMVVTYNTPIGRGWFMMRFELGERGADWEMFPPTVPFD